MTRVFDDNHLQTLAETHKTHYQSNTPYPHIQIDNFMNETYLQAALDAFPSPETFDFYQYDNPLEKKLAFDQIAKLPDPISDILSDMNSAPFLLFLEQLTGIDGLIPDPYYRGGGIHQIVEGGKLDVHIDFNRHPKLNLDRRLNVLIYLNKNWLESYGGYFELWEGYQKNGHHHLQSCKNKMLPLFNRLVVFSTSEHSYHGHPEPLTCPKGWSRKSIATYYYTNGRPKDETTLAHSTTFIKRPHEPKDKKIDALREKRNQGRLNSNITKPGLN